MTTQLWRRSFGLLLPLALFLGLFCVPAAASGSRHPYFNDRGTLSWHHSLAQAQRAAARLDKVIFIEYGRKKCTNCRRLAQDVLPHGALRARFADAAVGLAADCDRPERAVWQLFQRHLPGARTLPFAAFLTPDGQWITGWYGHRSVAQVSHYLDAAESHVRALRAPVRRAAQAACAPDDRAPRATSATPTRRTPAPVRRTVPHARRPVPRAPAPCPPAAPIREADPCEEECADSACCEGGSCKPPSFELPCLPNPFEVLSGGCKPKKAPAAAAPAPAAPPRVAAKPMETFPPPQPKVEHVREQGPAARPVAETATGSPDGAAQPAAALPAPTVRRVPTSRALPASSDLGSPDARPAPSALDIEERAKAAAARGDWAEVLVLTRGATEEQRLLRALNRKAHTWAHGRLAFALGAVRQRRFVEARDAVDEVKRSMRGEAEAVDAERGHEAIELMRDLDFLAERSPVRTTVRKTAYEKMRGTRWAPLFSPVPQPSAALSSR